MNPALSNLSPTQRFRRHPTGNQFLYALCLTLLIGLLPTSLYAADTPCTNVSGLPDEIERTEFCVYYDDGDTTNTQATTVANHVQDYWDRYDDDFAFREPKHSGKLEVRILDTSSCNGGTSSSSNNFTQNNGCFSIAESAQQTAGHELFHRVQYSYDGVEVKWFKEGTARAMEDMAFANIDNWPTTLSAAFSFNQQVKTYLNNTNVDITSIPQRYNSALWWKYFSEQFGSITTEPQRGVDTFLALWEAAETKDDIAALNQALSDLGAGINFDAAFRLFAGANWLKDFTNQPSGGWANYIDEDEAGNPAPYGPITPTSGGAISIGSSATFNNQSITRYGARYYRANPSSTNCPVVSMNVHVDSGPAFYHLVAQDGNAILDHTMNTVTDYSRSYFNTAGLDTVVAVLGSTNNSAQVDLEMSCVDPVIDIKLPNTGAKANVGPFDGPGKFLVQVQVTDGSPTGPVVSGLTVSDFKVRVNNNLAIILSGAFVQEQYWLLVQAPSQPVNDAYDLRVDLERSGTSTSIANDTEIDSVLYSSDNVDHLLVVDRSGSMSSDGKIDAARQAAKFYVDITRNGDGLAVIPYDTDVEPAPFDLIEVTAVPDVRNNAKVFINGPKLNPTGLTSIGDGLDEAANQVSPSVTGNPICSFILLSDGMENSAQFWATVQAKVVATGCPVTSIALGQASDETLMQAIATATGGAFFYNDVFTSASVAAAGADAINTETQTVLALGNAYEYAQGDSEGRQRLLAEMGIVADSEDVNTHEVMIDESVTEAVFSLDWDEPEITIDLQAAAAEQGERLKLILMDPDGNVFDHQKQPYSFADGSSGHVGWRVPNPTAGKWELLVSSSFSFDGPGIPYEVYVSGKSNLSIDLLLPGMYSTRAFSTGQRVPIYAFISGDSALPGLSPIARVIGPDGNILPVRLYDDGMHDDGAADDGFYGGSYTRLTRAQKVQPVAEDGQQSPEAKNEGSYRVQMHVQGMYQGLPFQREALGGFAVFAGEDLNNNGLPDPYEEENGVDSEAGDNDLDALLNGDEFELGTDPNNSDTDGGGENDDSEFNQGKDPFDPSDDEIEAPDFIKSTAGISLTLLTYDVKDEYDNRLTLWRQIQPDGNWQILETELPSTGFYSDTTVVNGMAYAYRYMAFDADNNRSAIVDSAVVSPTLDPYPPEALVLIDNGAPTTTDLDVSLIFTRTGEVEEAEGPDTFDDITEMKLSSDPTLAGASYQPFAQDVPWTLANTPPGDFATVYAQFKDDFGNESLITPASILVTSDISGTGSMTVTKLADKTQVDVGETISYTYEILNTGSVTLTSITASDDMLGAVTLDTTTLAPGETATGLLTHTVVEGDRPGPIVNEVTVMATPEGGDAISDTATESVAISSMTVTKLADKTQVDVGETISYTYEILNTGSVTLTSITANDDKLGAVTLDTTTLAPGETAMGLLTHTVVEGDRPGPIVNEVTVMATPEGGDAISDTATESVGITGSSSNGKSYLPAIQK